MPCWIRGLILLSASCKLHEANLKLSREVTIGKWIMWFVRIVVHVTLPKLYFNSWSLHFSLSQLSPEPVHSPNSPFSLLSLSACYLAAALSIPLPLFPSLSANCFLASPISQGKGGNLASPTPSPTLACFFSALVVRDNVNTIWSIFWLWKFDHR